MVSRPRRRHLSVVDFYEDDELDYDNCGCPFQLDPAWTPTLVRIYHLRNDLCEWLEAERPERTMKDHEQETLGVWANRDRRKWRRWRDGRR